MFCTTKNNWKLTTPETRHVIFTNGRALCKKIKWLWLYTHKQHKFKHVYNCINLYKLYNIKQIGHNVISFT